MTKHPRILIVDDEPRFCKSLETLLLTRNYAVNSCCNSFEALSLLQKNGTDLVLLDVYMERMDGFQTIQKIIDQKTDVPVIIMTGRASTDSAVKALRMGAIDYLKKPFEPDELFFAVKNALDQSELKEQLKEIENKCHTLVSTMPQGIELVDLDGKIIFSNPAHHRIQGYEEGELTGIISVISDITAQKQAEQGREKLLQALHDALENVKVLSGMLPICANCKNIRDDRGYWNKIEEYIEQHSDASFTHGLCPECSEKLYGDADWYIDIKKDKK